MLCMEITNERKDSSECFIYNVSTDISDRTAYSFDKSYADVTIYNGCVQKKISI